MRFVHKHRQAPVSLAQKSPLKFGYILTIGVLSAFATALALYQLRSIVFSVFLAMFVAVGINPLIRWLHNKGFSRPSAIVTSIVLLTFIIFGIFWLLVPVFLQQIQFLTTILTQDLATLHQKPWFASLNAISQGKLEIAIEWVSVQLSDEQWWSVLTFGIVGLGLSVLGAATTGVFISILSIYFVATYDVTKANAYRLISRSHRDTFISYSERILENFGKYLNGMALLAFFNASYSTILLLLLGFPNAIVVGVVAFFITLIPLIGTILTTLAMTFLVFVHDPMSAIIVFALMVLYMQIEAYILTPRIMRRAVRIPGTVVLISALAGSTLFGLLGALVAIPISAGILMIVTEVVMPEKEKR